VAVLRFELGFVRQRAEPNNLLDFVDSCFHLPVTIRAKSSIVGSSPALIAEEYLRATTLSNSMYSLGNCWIKAHLPLFIVEAESRELTRHARSLRRIVLQELDDVSIFHTTVKFREIDVNCAVWLIEKPETSPSSSAEHLRRLRIHLCRFHAERECLSFVLRHIQRKKLTLGGYGTPPSDWLQHYLDESVKWISKKSVGGVSASKIFRFAQELSASTEEGLAESTLAQLRHVRKTVLKRCNDLLSASPGIMADTFMQVVYERGSIHQGENMVKKQEATVTNSSYVQLSQSGRDSSGLTMHVTQGPASSPEIAAQLQALELSISNIMGELAKKDEAQQERAQRSIETISNELKKERPDHSWLSISKDGLIEAAKTVGALGAPVIQAVQELFKLVYPS
jgi:hypothetical protein